ncbi:hypothetical protein R1flu_026613 [Riccia fluitans]|uniref:Uncharacterized protein n=1 Tax=Riccia fluitans TaxID=41844 RepID=A0ABD1XGH9_9MARC
MQNVASRLPILEECLAGDSPTPRSQFGTLAVKVRFYFSSGHLKAHPQRSSSSSASEHCFISILPGGLENLSDDLEERVPFGLGSFAEVSGLNNCSGTFSCKKHLLSTHQTISLEHKVPPWQEVPTASSRWSSDVTPIFFRIGKTVCLLKAIPSQYLALRIASCFKVVEPGKAHSLLSTDVRDILEGAKAKTTPTTLFADVFPCN